MKTENEDNNLGQDKAGELGKKVLKVLMDQKHTSGEIVANIYALNKGLGMAKIEADKIQGHMISSNVAIDKISAKAAQLAKTESQRTFFNDRIKNIQENQTTILEAHAQAQGGLYKLEVARETGLRGAYLSQAAEFKLMVSKGAMTEKDYKKQLENLKIQQDKTEELENQLKMEEEIASEILAIKDNTESWGKSINKVWATSKAIANDPKALGALAMSQVVKLGKEGVHRFEELRESGMSAGQAGEAAFKTFSLKSMMGLSDTKGALKGLQEEFGAVSGFSADVVDDIGSIAHEMGISGQEAGKLVAQTMKMTGATAEQATAQLEVTKQIALQNGLNPGAVSKEVAENMGQMSRFTKGGVAAFAQIASEAKKIGLELKTAVSMADSLLDFESSLEKQMEASVLLGKELNFDKARQLALQNDAVGAAKEMLSQIGGIEEFNSMNVVQQKALADSMGMSVEQLQEAVNGQESMNEAIGEGVDAETEGWYAKAEAAMGAINLAKEYGTLGLSLIQMATKENLTKGIGYAQAAAHWVKEKAMAAWRFATGQKLDKQAADGAKKMLKKDGTPDMRFKENKLKAKTPKVETKGGDLAGKAGKDAGAAGKAAGPAKKAGGVGQSLKDLANGVAAFAKGKVILGALVGLPATAVGLVAMLAGIPTLLAVALVGTAAGIGFAGLAKGVGKMGGGNVLKGALGLLVLGAAMIPAAFAFSLLANVDIGKMIAFAIILPLLGLAAAGLGFLIVPIALGAVALALLGVGLIAVAAGIMLFAAAEDGIPALQAFVGVFAENPTVGLSFLLASVGLFVFAGALIALAIAAFFGTPALIALGAGMLLLGLGVKFASEGLVKISEVLPDVAEGAMGLGAAAGLMSIAAVGIVSLGLAGLVAAPGLLIASLALGALAVTMGLFAVAVTAAMPGVALLMELGAMADIFVSIAESMWSMAAGIAAFATAGLLTLPTIMGLIALSFVAPILTLLGDSINYDLQSNSAPPPSMSDEKMDTLIEEVRSLKAAFQTPGTINMDGQKVGDVLGLAISNSGLG